MELIFREHPQTNCMDSRSENLSRNRACASLGRRAYL